MCNRFRGWSFGSYSPASRTQQVMLAAQIVYRKVALQGCEILSRCWLCLRIPPSGCVPAGENLISRATSLGGVHGCFGENPKEFSAGSPVPPSPGGHLVICGQSSITPPVVNSVQGWDLHSLLILNLAFVFALIFTTHILPSSPTWSVCGRSHGRPPLPGLLGLHHH